MCFGDFLFLLSIHKQLAGVVPQRDRHESDSSAEAGSLGPLQSAAASEGLSVKLQSGLQQL